MSRGHLALAERPDLVGQVHRRTRRSGGRARRHDELPAGSPAKLRMLHAVNDRGDNVFGR